MATAVPGPAQRDRSSLPARRAGGADTLTPPHLAPDPPSMRRASGSSAKDRRRSRERLRALGAAAAILAGTAAGTPALGQGTGAAAGAAVGPLFLDVSPHAGCKDSGDLARRVARRSQRIPFAIGPAADTAHAAVSVVGDAVWGFDATLVFTTPAGRVWSRRLHADSCDEAFDALAVVLAVTLDARAVASPPVHVPASGAVVKPPSPLRATAPPAVASARGPAGPVELAGPGSGAPPKPEPAAPVAPMGPAVAARPAAGAASAARRPRPRRRPLR